MLDAKVISEMLERPLPVTVFDRLESTNITAREIARGDLREQVIITRTQTGGRGRLGRSFFSPTGGLYMSLILRPRVHASEAIKITTTAAVAVARAIDASAGTRCEIKWVNDVYISGRKVCGILTESKINSDGMLDFAILGIGVNLVPPEGGFPAEIADRAGAVFDVLHDNADNLLAAGIINEFLRLYGVAHSRECLDEYRSRSCVIGREVDVMRVVDGDTTPATAVDIDDEFRLIVRCADGRTEALGSGEVSVRAQKAH